MEYSEGYFNWQKEVGEFGGLANRFKFEEHIKDDDIVIDFGSGGGYLLKNIQCREKIGIEVNEVARKEATSNEVSSVSSIEDINDGYADVIISNHALEHVECPLDVIKALKLKLREGGKIVFVVPHQGPKEKFKKGDVNQHLYTWNPMTLGTLFEGAGYKDVKVSTIRHKWPPNFKRIYSLMGLKGFHLTCYLYALFKDNYQIKVEAKK